VGGFTVRSIGHPIHLYIGHPIINIGQPINVKLKKCPTIKNGSNFVAQPQE
jgi:hypothetical protein